MLYPTKHLLVILTIGAGGLAVLSDQTSFAAGTPPVGTFLWLPEGSTPPSEQDCRSLVERVRPSREKAEAHLWGRVPYDQSDSSEFYLIVTESRMDSTFAAEGDYDTGTITFGAAYGDRTPFTLVPDDHPDTVITGLIEAPQGKQVVAVTLRALPVDDRTTERTTYYCRFDEAGSVI